MARPTPVEVGLLPYAPRAPVLHHGALSFVRQDGALEALDLEEGRRRRDVAPRPGKGLTSSTPVAPSGSRVHGLDERSDPGPRSASRAFRDAAGERFRSDRL
ncbi:MAG TPA: hypothetical protein RMH99_18370 [Sandaracinaceae bacterium LLY-WYZ-13_1]|nr:hypothetical protein [Sandaracinaceae bacterium LLY-WYZ-13_1]